jgi:hypothetical protein
MESLGEVTGDEHTVEEILALAEAHRDRESSGDTATFYAIWLDGHFHDGEEVRDSVLGVSIGHTGVIAMFKPVIESTDMPILPVVAPFVEQTTLIHELGHAIGLVDNGLPMSADHHDDDHRAHCIHQDCVMYWANEGAADMREFVRSYVTSGDVILFDDQCLADIDARSAP